MSNRKILIIVMIALFGSVTFFTWGSIGSAITAYGTLMMVLALPKELAPENPYEDYDTPPEE